MDGTLSALPFSRGLILPQSLPTLHHLQFLQKLSLVLCLEFAIEIGKRLILIQTTLTLSEARTSFFYHRYD